MNYWKKYWDKLAESKDDLLAGDWTYVSVDQYNRRIHHIGKILDLRSKDTLIDIGCGAGLFEQYNNRDIAHYIGVDFSFYLLSNGKKKLYSYPISFTFVQGDCKALPFKDSSINTMIVNSVTHYISEEDFKETIKEIARVMNKGSVCFLGDIESNSPLSNRKEEASSNIYFKLKSLLKKAHCLVWLNSTINQAIVDIKRGFRVRRKRTNRYHADKVIEWIRNVDVELETEILEQESAFYGNRYDVLIKKRS